MGSTSQQYCLRWKNHSSNLLNVFEELLQNEAFTDVTLAVEGGASIKCHKMVLAACSSYFQSLFIDLPCKHPIVVLKDVKYSEMKAILEYIYRGEVNVAQEQLGGLLNVAEVLKVKGLVEENSPQSRGRDEEVETSSSPPPAISTSTATSNSMPHSNGHASPIPHSTDGSYNSYSGTHEGSQNRLAVPGMWPLPGLPLPQHPASAHQHPPSHSTPLLGGSYDNGYENSPLKRKKISNLMINRDTPILRTVLGQEHADSSQAIPLLHPDSHESHIRANSSSGSATDEERRNSTDFIHAENAHTSYSDGTGIEEEEKRSSPQPYTESKSGSGCKKLKRLVNHATAQKPEWRRYKQYTREDLLSAIEAVRSGMSALRAAPKFGVPSRTLYDKLRNLGITTSRPFKRGSNGSSACFPYGIGGNANGGIYPSGLLDNDGESSNPNTTQVESPPSVYEGSFKGRSDSADRETVLDVAQHGSPTPVIHSLTKHPQRGCDDQADDLSVTRKADLRVIVPPTKSLERDSTAADTRN